MFHFPGENMFIVQHRLSIARGLWGSGTPVGSEDKKIHFRPDKKTTLLDRYAGEFCVTMPSRVDLHLKAS